MAHTSKPAESLRSPPYNPSHASYRLLSGVTLGDPVLSSMSNAEFQRLKFALDYIEPDPVWVDHESVKRGQQFFHKHFGSMMITLTMMLMRGFVVSRFSEVLVLSGYTSSLRATFERFKHTAAAITEWMSHDLTDPSGKGRKSLLTVRCMHEYARRHVADKFGRMVPEGDVSDLTAEPDENLKGIPLSQFDLATVQLGFAAICLSGIANDLGTDVSPQERADFYHCWRYLGQQLGILDQYNVCQDVEECDRMRDEFIDSLDFYAKHASPACLELLHCTLESFGKFTGAGRVAFSALIHSADRRIADAAYLESHAPLESPAAWFVTKRLLRYMSQNWLPRQLLNAMFRGQIRFGMAHPRIMGFVHTFVFPPRARFADAVWRLLDWLVNLVRMLNQLRANLSLSRLTSSNTKAIEPSSSSSSSSSNVITTTTTIASIDEAKSEEKKDDESPARQARNAIHALAAASDELKQCHTAADQHQKTADALRVSAWKLKSGVEVVQSKVDNAVPQVFQKQSTA